MKVKICGITSVESAIDSVEAGADALGFMFAKSKRKISPDDAREIIDHLPNDVDRVGVFVNETPEMVKDIADYCRLTAIQLHGEESVEDYLSLQLNLIKSVKVTIDGPGSLCNAKAAHSILLDTAGGKYRGGNGKPFDWNLVKDIGRTWPNIILAGGLDKDNVQKAIKVVKPYMVDVSSGVEINGKKSKLLIKEFIEKVKGVEIHD